MLLICVLRVIRLVQPQASTARGSDHMCCSVTPVIVWYQSFGCSLYLRGSERGRDEGKKDTTHCKSMDVVNNLEARVSRLESNLGTLGERVDDLDGHCNCLETEDAKIQSGIKDMLGGLETELRLEIESLHSEIAKVRDLFQRELSNVLLRVVEMGGDLALCKQAVATGVTTTTTIEARKVEVPKPKTFNGTRNGREVENFLWGLEQYFEATGVMDDAGKIRNAALYLTDTIMLW
ncbi:hypothetical protein PanWU01x14_169200 [Parasponia andersonii]|uniref:Uncharacterized protein n=1 Tax=Parasponia andersonii TaxID=3476 RepID=A0A2P5CAA6_PARAD|nr:hypothetical protein PanWU01x14_169200 [Parasponia andersonii]